MNAVASPNEALTKIFEKRYGAQRYKNDPRKAGKKPHISSSQRNINNPDSIKPKTKTPLTESVNEKPILNIGTPANQGEW